MNRKEEVDKQKFNQEKFEQALEEYKRTSIKIGRIPEQYKTTFMKIAKEEFADDYGLCLREMIKTWQGIYVHPNDELQAKIDVLADEIAKLKEKFTEQTKQPQGKPIVAADGSIKGYKKE
ncbi:MAG: hypothetical protein ACTSX6_04830 [Candidatus Heimdallarchaeaceae archaeon]